MAIDLTKAVEQTLLAIRPYIRSFESGGALEALATGQTCLAFDYSGDVTQLLPISITIKKCYHTFTTTQ